MKEITTENAYTFDVTGVVRPDRLGEGYTPEDAMIEVTQGDSSRNDELSCPGNPPAIAYDVEFEINCFVRQSDFDVAAYNTLQNERGAQIVKAITGEATDPGAWHTMAGNAMISDIGDITEFKKSVGDHNGVSVALRVTYRVSENNQYTVRA